MAVFKLSDIIAAEDKARGIINNLLQDNAMSKSNETRRINAGKPWSVTEWNEAVNRRKDKHKLIRQAIVKAYPDVIFSDDYSQKTVWPPHEDNALIEINGFDSTESTNLIPYISFEGTLLNGYIPPNLLTSMYDGIKAAQQERQEQSDKMENLTKLAEAQKNELDKEIIPQPEQQPPLQENISIADQYAPHTLFKLWEDLNNKIQALLEKYEALIFSNDDISDQTYNISDSISELKNNLVIYSKSHKLSEENPKYNFKVKDVYNHLKTRIEKLNEEVEDHGVFLEQSSLKANDTHQPVSQELTYDDVKKQAQEFEDDYNQLRLKVNAEKVILTEEQITKSNKIVDDAQHVTDMLENENTADLATISNNVISLKKDLASFENDVFKVKDKNQPPVDPNHSSPFSGDDGKKVTNDMPNATKPRSLNLTNSSKTYAPSHIVEVNEQIYEDSGKGEFIVTNIPIFATIEEDTSTNIKRASAVYTFDIPKEPDEKIQLAKAAVASALELGQKSPLVIGGTDMGMLFAAIKVCEASGITYKLDPEIKLTQDMHTDMTAFKANPKAKAEYAIKTDDYNSNKEAPADRVAKNIALCVPAVNPGPQKVVTRPVAQQHVQNSLKDKVEQNKKEEDLDTLSDDDLQYPPEDDVKPVDSSDSGTKKPTTSIDKMKNEMNNDVDKKHKNENESFMQKLMNKLR